MYLYTYKTMEPYKLIYSFFFFFTKYQIYPNTIFPHNSFSQPLSLHHHHKHTWKSPLLPFFTKTTMQHSPVQGQPTYIATALFDLRESQTNTQTFFFLDSQCNRFPLALSLFFPYFFPYLISFYSSHLPFPLPFWLTIRVDRYTYCFWEFEELRAEKV